MVCEHEYMNISPPIIELATALPLSNCWGFIDGTVRPVSRLGKHQRTNYNGHKRVHAIKFISIVAPNGLIANLYGPVVGKRHDSGMLAESGLLGDLQQYSYSPDGQPLCAYGDPAYPISVDMQRSFAGPELTAMSRVRVSVEWVLGDIANYFTYVEKKLRIGLSAVGKIPNARTCLYKSVTSSFFGLDPPELDV